MKANTLNSSNVWEKNNTVSYYSQGGNWSVRYYQHYKLGTYS